MKRALLLMVALSSELAMADDPAPARDPFRSPYAAQAVVAGKPAAPCRASSCLADESDLQLVGIVSGTSTPTAMVQDRAGRAFVLRRHSPVGANGARVERIDATCVHVVRFVLASDGRSEKVTSRLCVAAADHTGGDLDYASGALR